MHHVPDGVTVENTHFYYYHYLLSLEGIYKRLGLYKVLTCSQGNLEAKGEPRATNMGQIKYTKTYSKAGLEPQVTWIPAKRHTWWSSLQRLPKGQILTVLLSLSHLLV